MTQSPSATRQTLVLAGFIVVTFCAPLAGMFSLPGEWYAALDKPSWNPPGWIFGPVWTLLYLMMAMAAWLVWKRVGWQRALVLLGMIERAEVSGIDRYSSTRDALHRLP